MNREDMRRLVTDADIDRMLQSCENMIDKIDRQLAKRTRFTLHHDDGDGEIDASDPSLDAIDDAENSGDDNPGDNDLEDEDEEDEEDASTIKMRKDVVNPYLRERDRTNRPGALSTSTHPPNRHKFESVVDKLKNDNAIPKSQAMAMARMQFPDLYASYQDHTNGSTSKREPDLVEIEMRKGCTREVAMQRLAQQHGFGMFDQPSRIQKRRGDLLYEFQKRVTEVMDQDGCDAAEATRRVRKEDPRLYAAMQRTG
jgi:hypothetical protein